MLLPIATDIFCEKYRHELRQEQYFAYLEKGLSFLETEGINTNVSLGKLKAQRIALEYREAVIKQLLGMAS